MEADWPRRQKGRIPTKDEPHRAISCMYYQLRDFKWKFEKSGFSEVVVVAVSACTVSSCETANCRCHVMSYTFGKTSCLGRQKWTLVRVSPIVTCPPVMFHSLLVTSHSQLSARHFHNRYFVCQSRLTVTCLPVTFYDHVSASHVPQSLVCQSVP